MPTALPQSGSIVAHWDANTITPQSDNTNLTSGWTDSVGSINAAQATSGLQPKYRTNRINGLPSVQFSGGQVLDAGTGNAASNAIDTTICSTFIVFKAGANGGFGALIAATAGGSSYFLYVDGTNAGRFGNAQTVCPYPAQNGVFSTLGSTSTTDQMQGAGTGLERTFINGGCFGSFVAPAPTTGANHLCIGSNAGNNFPVIAEIFDVVIWNRQLTPTEILICEMWARDKYAQPYPWLVSPYFTIMAGDSITDGVGIVNDQGEAYPYKLAQKLGLAFGQWSNLGIGGITATGMLTNAPNEVQNLAATINRTVVACAFEWYNQKGPAATAEAATNAWVAAVRNVTLKVVLGTSTGMSTSDTTTYGANRAAYDTYYDTNNTSLVDAYVPIHLNPYIGTDSAQANFPAHFNQGDFVHLTPAGYTILAGLFFDGVNQLTTPRSYTMRSDNYF